MPLTEHLSELRSRVIRILVIVSVGFGITYSQGEVVAEYLLKPLRDVLAAGNTGEVVFLGVLDKVLAQFQVAFWSALILTAPLWFWQIWGFIKPGLYKKEVNVIRPFIFVGFLFFALGVAFGYYIVFPLTFQTLMDFGVQNVKATMSLKEYLVLSVKVLVFLGFVFQLPNILLISGYMGLVTKQSLRKSRPFVYVGFSVLSAILTPPDPLTMMMLWVPLVCLFEFGILAVAVLVHPWLARRVSEEESEMDLDEDLQEPDEPHA